MAGQPLRRGDAGSHDELPSAPMTWLGPKRPFPHHPETRLKMRRKSDLPTKICATCGRPFAWRRKWAAVWNEVKYCSDRCRAARPTAGAAKPGRTR